MKSPLFRRLAAAPLLVLAACAVQPDPHPSLPQTVAAVAPSAWHAEAPTADIAPDLWWTQFGDARLHALIERVLQNNLDLKSAEERLRQARQLTLQRRAILLPELNAGAQAADQRQNAPPPLGYVREVGFGLDATWHVDVFGGEKLDVLAAQAQVKGRESALAALRLGLAANTATAYIDLRWAQEQARILRDNLEIRQKTLAVTQSRLRFGMSSQLDVARAENQLEDLQARLPGVRSIIEHDLNLIAIYSGETPEAAARLADVDTGTVPAAPASVPRTLPSQALLRRPDVQEAYATVEQRAAEVGVARAQRYPQFTISLADGLLASSYIGLPTLTDNLFSAALNATAPIFNAGRITANIDAKESRMREAQWGLQQALLQALKEIEDSRRDLIDDAAQVDRLQKASAAAGRALQLSNRLYLGGTLNFLDLAIAQEAYLKESESLNQGRRDHALAAVALYRTLGGGWSDAATAQ